MGEAALALAFLIAAVLAAIFAVVAWLDGRRLDREAAARAAAGDSGSLTSRLEPAGVELASVVEATKSPPRAIVRKLRRNRADLRRALGRKS